MVLILSLVYADDCSKDYLKLERQYKRL